MQNFSFKLSVFLLALLLSTQAVFPQNKEKNVVIFFSFNSSIPAYQNILEGFREKIMDKQDFPINLFIEYFDLDRSQNESYVKQIVDLYNYKFTERKIDLLITVGPGINKYLSKYNLNALAHSQVLELENENLAGTPAPDTSGTNIFRVTLSYNFENTINSALKLFPGHNKVYLIWGNSAIDKYYDEHVLRAALKFEKTHDIIQVKGYSLDSINKFVKDIAVKSIILLPSFISDNANIFFSTPEVISIIANSSKAPVIPFFDTFVKRRGGLGGFVFSYKNLGFETGRIAKEMLTGKHLSDIKVNENSFYQNIYDWDQLKKWNILNSRMIPANSIIINEKVSFITEYRWYFFGLFLFLIFETITILYLIRLNRRQKAVEKQKAETEILFRELIREDRRMRMVELTAALSHELNQPLTGILYSAQAGKQFLQSGKLDHDQAQEIFDNIIDDDKRAGDIISSIKSLMKLEIRDMEKTDLGLVISDAIKIFDAEAAKRKIRLSYKLPVNPIYVKADKIMIEQVLLNFIYNAAIAMQNTDPEKKLIELKILLKNGNVIVSVRDWGPGIDHTIRDKIFNSFVTTRKTGFGIGLAVSRSIMEKHKGEIWADNMPDGGAQFSFSLKVVKYEE